MNVIWHHYEGMQSIMPEDIIAVVVVGFHNHVRGGRLAEVDRSSAGFVQQSIHSGKCPSRVESLRRESPVRRQTVVETPCEEDRLVNLMEVRQSPPVERHTCDDQPTGGRLRTQGSALPIVHTRITSSRAPICRPVRYNWGFP